MRADGHDGDTLALLRLVHAGLPMPFRQRLTDWLETHWVGPAYSGWLMLGLALFFFAAATNTMAGWLYAISGVMLALVGIAVVLPGRSLRDLQVTRRPIMPVHLGEALQIEVAIANPTAQPRGLLQVIDQLPPRLGQPAEISIEAIAPQETYRWVYSLPTQQRGVFRWKTLVLRTAAPLGLFWSRHSRIVQAIAVVYPQVLPLNQCPLVDELGQDLSTAIPSDRRAQTATEGVTRTLRPYRWGDPTRLIHWRTSARYGELRVRELEVYTGGQELVICLDSSHPWVGENFEQAVSAAASLYCYALRHRLSVGLWTAGTGLVRGEIAVLEVLAAVQPGEPTQASSPPTLPLLWLSQTMTQLAMLPPGSRWLLWADPSNHVQVAPDLDCRGQLIYPHESLQEQLQKPLSYRNCT